MKIFVTKRSWLLTGVIVICVIVAAGMFLDLIRRPEVFQARANKQNAMQVIKKTETVIPVASPDFFIEYRIEREKIRSEKSDLLRDIMKAAVSDDVRKEAQKKVLQMFQEKQQEMEMENLIKARGFSDAIVFIRDHSVSVVVKSNNMNRDEVVQIADIVKRVSGVQLENVAISAKP